MSEKTLERTAIDVPINMGPLIGNTLRQFAMRGTNTWQVAGYRAAGKEGSFGLSGGYDFSDLKFLSGSLVCDRGATDTTEMLCKFTLQGGVYVYEDMKLYNLEKLGIPALDVCIVYANGSRSAEQNCSVVQHLCPDDADNFVVVPSRHTLTIKFKYSVMQKDQHTDVLVIDATEGVVSQARESAVKLLSGLHI